MLCIFYCCENCILFFKLHLILLLELRTVTQNASDRVHKKRVKLFPVDSDSMYEVSEVFAVSSQSFPLSRFTNVPALYPTSSTYFPKTTFIPKILIVIKFPSEKFLFLGRSSSRNLTNWVWISVIFVEKCWNQSHKKTYVQNISWNSQVDLRRVSTLR